MYTKVLVDPKDEGTATTELTEELHHSVCSDTNRAHTDSLTSDVNFFFPVLSEFRRAGMPAAAPSKKREPN